MKCGHSYGRNAHAKAISQPIAIASLLGNSLALAPLSCGKGRWNHYHEIRIKQEKNTWELFQNRCSDTVGFQYFMQLLSSDSEPGNQL